MLLLGGRLNLRSSDSSPVNVYQTNHLEALGGTKEMWLFLLWCCLPWDKQAVCLLDTLFETKIEGFDIRILVYGLFLDVWRRIVLTWLPGGLFIMPYSRRLWPVEEVPNQLAFCSYPSPSRETGHEIRPEKGGERTCTRHAYAWPLQNWMRLPKVDF